MWRTIANNAAEISTCSRGRHEDDHQQPDHVHVPQPRIGPPDVPEGVMVIAPRGGDRDKADQERQVLAIVVAGRRPERGGGGALGHRQVDGEQRDRDCGNGVGKEDQPID